MAITGDDGANLTTGNWLPYQLYNYNKNHWYGATAPTAPVNGLIWVKNDGTVWIYFGAWMPLTGMNIVETKTDNYAITTADFGKTLVMNAVDKTFSLPSVAAANIGAVLKFVFISTGTLTIDAADSDTIDDSGAGDGIYCTQNGEKYSSITLKLVTATAWIILAAKGIWTTTD